MKKICTVLMSLCLSVVLFSVNVVATENYNNPIELSTFQGKTNYVPNQVVVLTNNIVDLSKYSSKSTETFNGINITEIKPLFEEEPESEVENKDQQTSKLFAYVITLDNTTSVQTAVEILGNSENVISAEPNYYAEAVPITESELTNNTLNTNDSSTGTSVVQWAHTYLRISTVWSRSFIGSKSIKVAVLDTGFVQTADLENNLDMTLAYDVADEDANVHTTDSHGNRVAGVICADYNDGGVNGICRNVTVIPIKICSDTTPSQSSTATILKGVNRAIDSGANIINLSFTLGESSAIRNTIANNQVLFITSADNENIDMALSEKKGKLHDDPYWIVVGAAASDQTKYPTSNFSSRYCDIFAPGEDIDTTSLTGAVTTGNQTSLATPHVTAACALIMSHATHKTPLEVKNMILQYAKSVSTLSGLCVSEGTLSIMNVINRLYIENRGAYTRGDVNGDEVITSADTDLIRNIYYGEVTPSTDQLSAADINKNGTIDSTDVTLSQRYVNKTYYFPPQ